MNFTKFLRTPFFKEHLRRLLLYCVKIVLKSGGSERVTKGLLAIEDGYIDVNLCNLLSDSRNSIK